MWRRIRKIGDWCLVGVAMACPTLAAFFLGITAHGQRLSSAELTKALTYLIVLLAVGLRTPLWVLSGRDRPRLVRHVASQVTLVLGTWCLFRLGFQSGLAVHCPPSSLAEFFTMEP
jgi:hypothetical protein